MTEAWSKPYHVVVEVENKDCKMLKKLSQLGLQNLKVADLRSTNKGSVKHLIELNREQIKGVPSNISPRKRKMQIQDNQTIWFESKGCQVCNTILSHDAFLVTGKSLELGRILYSFMVPTFEVYKSTILELEKTGHTVTVLKLGEFKPKTGLLTENQERVFWLALKGGYFDFPRKIKARELSKKLGVKPSTLSETLRRGTRRLLESYFKEEPGST